jgi:hypothetical protein
MMIKTQLFCHLWAQDEELRTKRKPPKMLFLSKKGVARSTIKITPNKFQGCKETLVFTCARRPNFWLKAISLHVALCHWVISRWLKGRGLFGFTLTCEIKGHEGLLFWKWAWGCCAQCRAKHPPLSQHFSFDHSLQNITT